MGAIAQRISAEDPRGPELDRRSAADVLDELHLPSPARELVEHTTIRDDYTVEPLQLSALFLAQGYKLTNDLTASGVEAFRIRGGNDQLPARFARSLGNAVHRGSPVTRISALSDRVRVHVEGKTGAGAACVTPPPPPPRGETASPPAPPPLIAEAI